MKSIEVGYKEVKGMIWKILPDELGMYLVVESRDVDSRNTIISLLNLETNSVVYSNDNLPKPWWISLKSVYKDVVFLQGYKDSTSPESKGVYAYDLVKGNLLWKEEEAVFNVLKNGKLVLGGVGENSLVERVVNYKTGVVVASNESIQVIEQDSEQRKLYYPFLYTEESEHYKTISDYIATTYSLDCIGAIEYMEYNSFIIVSFYHLKNKKFTNVLVVLNENGNCILEEVIAEDKEGIGTASFFICKTKLVFSKNKSSIGIIELI